MDIKSFIFTNHKNKQVEHSFVLPLLNENGEIDTKIKKWREKPCKRKSFSKDCCMSTVFSVQSKGFFADARKLACDYKIKNMVLIKQGLFVLCMFSVWYFPS